MPKCSMRLVEQVTAVILKHEIFNISVLLGHKAQNVTSETTNTFMLSYIPAYMQPIDLAQYGAALDGCSYVLSEGLA